MVSSTSAMKPKNTTRQKGIKQKNKKKKTSTSSAIPETINVCFWPLVTYQFNTRLRLYKPGKIKSGLRVLQRRMQKTGKRIYCLFFFWMKQYPEFLGSDYLRLVCILFGDDYATVFYR